MKKVLYFALLTIFLASCQNDETTDFQADLELQAVLTNASNGKGFQVFKLPESTDFQNIPQDPRNPITTDKVILGQLLYHETGLARANVKEVGKFTYSCASCHFASAGFQAGTAQGIADGGIGFGKNGEGRTMHTDYLPTELDVQPIRTPSAMNMAYQEVILWNGQFGATGPNVGTEFSWDAGTPKETNHLGYQGVETQAIAGLKVHRLQVDKAVIQELGYQEYFDKIFPDWPEERRYSREAAGLAIAAFERTMLSNQAPFQRWLKGEWGAMSEQEKSGAMLFFGKAECSSCHNGPALSSMTFYGLGMKDLTESPNTFFVNPDDPAHKGRGGFTKRPEDMFKFKTPQLYNLADSPFYGHGSSFQSIRDVVAYKNKANPENSTVPASQIASQFHPLNLSEQEIDDLVAFLTNSLHDPNLKRYEPQRLFSGLCFPNNDNLSRTQLGCN